MKTAKITYEDVKHFLTEDQKEKVEYSQDTYFKKEIDRRIRMVNNADNGNIPQGVLNNRSNALQIAYSRLQNLTYEQSERFTQLLDRLSKSDIEEMDYRNIAYEFREFEEMDLLHVSRTQPYNRIIYAGIKYPGIEIIKPMFESLRKTYLYKDLL